MGSISYHETFRGDKKPKQSQNEKGRELERLKRPIPAVQFRQISPLETNL